MKKIWNKLKKVTIKDIFGILKFLIVLLPALIKKCYLKLNQKEVWLICEQSNTAHDNGYIFFKYMKEHHPEIKCFYAINKKCFDYRKVAKFKDIINWSSIKHYYYYLSVTKNISSHKEGNPNQTLFTILNIYMNLFNNRVFLQHGVLYQYHDMFNYKNAKFKIFITGAKPEYEFVKAKYGYKNNEIKYTGLARFDNLFNYETDNKTILLIPTWRRWLDTDTKFIKSNYFKRLLSLINNPKLEEILIKHDKYLYFYPHISTQKYINNYKTNNKRVKILNASAVDIQKLLKKGSLLITDFSSIHTDFAFMNKPVIYYQYDKEEFFKKHYSSYPESYFDFKKDGFGNVINNEDKLIEEIEKNIISNFKLENKFKERINNFFILHDNKNCERIFNTLVNNKY